MLKSVLLESAPFLCYAG